MGRLTAIVLGAAAGGGFPQWNCQCPVCRLAWAGDRRAKPRTQASLAVSADGEHWILLNASPDLRAQLLATPALQPRPGAARQPDQRRGPDRRRGRSDRRAADVARTPGFHGVCHRRHACGAGRQSDLRRAGRRSGDAQGRGARRALFRCPAASMPSCSPFPARWRSISRATIRRSPPKPAPMSASNSSAARGGCFTYRAPPA